jgi:hypothetical protein
MASSSKRLVAATLTKETRFVLARPLVGYKFVTDAYGPPICSVSGDTFAVGSHHKLPPTPTLYRQGYHFATNPLLLLESLAWKPTYRLVRIEVPAGATVATNGVTYATSELRVVADDTASAAAVLTGVIRIANLDHVSYVSYVAGEEMAVLDNDAPFCVIATIEGDRRKYWHDAQAKEVCVYQQGNGAAVVSPLVGSSAVPRDVWEARFKTQEWYETIAV